MVSLRKLSMCTISSSPQKEEFAFEKIEEEEIMVSLRQLSMCTISSSPQKTTTATTTTTKKESSSSTGEMTRHFKFYSNLYKHCQISVTHMIMVELRCF